MGDKIKKNYWIALSVIVIAIIAAIGIFYISSQKEPGVYREISKTTLNPGEIFTLKLDVKLGKDKTFYVIEEDIPSEFEIIGESYKDNKIKIAKIMNAKDTTYTYQIKAPNKPGTYTFEGVYGMDNMDKVQPITGDISVTVK